MSQPTVTLKLAHPLSAEQARKVLAQDVRDYWAGDEIRLRRDYALTVINAGYAAGVDPRDAAQVKRALAGQAAPAAATAEGAAEAEPKKTTTTKK